VGSVRGSLGSPQAAASYTDQSMRRRSFRSGTGGSELGDAMPPPRPAVEEMAAEVVRLREALAAAHAAAAS